MSVDISVHDNLLVSYEVLSEQREIRLRTEFRGRETIVRTDVIFRGVEAYRFYGDNFENIIAEIAEVPADDILEEESARFEDGRQYCWPGAWNESDATLRAHLADRKIRGFLLSSSFGMGGLVLAHEMEKISRDGPSKTCCA